jgi:hypothetical protein
MGTEEPPVLKKLTADTPEYKPAFPERPEGPIS